MLFIRAPFYVLLVFVAMCSVFWLFWLSYQYLPSDWLERLLWGSLIVARGSSPESPGRRVRMIFLVYCIASLFYYVFVLSPAPTWYNIFLLLWRDIAYLCWKVPLSPKQTNHLCWYTYESTFSELYNHWWFLNVEAGVSLLFHIVAGTGFQKVAGGFLFATWRHSSSGIHFRIPLTPPAGLR